MLIPFCAGRVVVKGLGGGIKHKYHWIDWYRVGPKDDSPPTIEKVLKIIKSGIRTADIALVGVEGRLKYIVASANMKAGDLLKTSMFIPRIPGSVIKATSFNFIFFYFCT